MSDSKKMCQLLFLDNHIMHAQWALWRLIYYRGDKRVPAAIFLRNRSPVLIKSDSSSGHKYLSAHLWKAGEPWLLCSFCHMKVQMETLRVGSCISHSWNKTANKKGIIMMLHHLTQLGGLGCLPACYNREKEIPPVNNGTCAFMSALCLRGNFENVWSVCHLPPSSAPSSPLLSPQLFTLLL